MRPDGQPIFVCDVAPGHLHDLTVARDAGVIGALNWAAGELDLATLADSGYEGAGQGIKTPVKQPAAGQSLALDNQAYNTLLRSTRCLGERGFALLTGRWRALQRVTVSPRRIGELAQAALVLTRIENVQLRLLVEITSVPGRGICSWRGPSFLALSAGIMGASLRH